RVALTEDERLRREALFVGECREEESIGLREPAARQAPRLLLERELGGLALRAGRDRARGPLAREELLKEVVQAREPPRQAGAQMAQPRGPVGALEEELGREAEQRRRPFRARVRRAGGAHEGFFAREIPDLGAAHGLGPDRRVPDEREASR